MLAVYTNPSIRKSPNGLVVSCRNGREASTISTLV